MPTLPLPAGDVPIQGGDLPVTDNTDVVPVFPMFVQDPPVAPVRDAIVAGETAMFLEVQRRGEYASAQSDPNRATGYYQDGLLADRGFYRQLNEQDVPFRTRSQTVPAVATPAAILAAANGVLAPYTSIQAAYLEENDGWFVTSTLGGGQEAQRNVCFVYNGPQFNASGQPIASNASPFYPDRLYPDDSVYNAGFVCPRRIPGGCRVFQDSFGRYFEIRLPDLSPLDANVYSAYNETLISGFVWSNPTMLDPNGNNSDGLFCSDGSSTLNINSFLATSADSSADIYNAVVAAVEQVKGHSMRWTCYIDPQLIA